MSYYFPEGTKLFYSVTFAAAKTVSALSNANPASATSAAHGYIDNDEVLFLSGWEEANESVFRVDQIDAATHTFLGLDATNTQLFPPGGGVGTTQKISTWVEVPQVLTITGSGGDAKYGTIAPLAKRQEIQRAIGFNASATNFTMGWDPANATYQAMLALAHAAGGGAQDPGGRHRADLRLRKHQRQPDAQHGPRPGDRCSGLRHDERPPHRLRQLSRRTDCTATAWALLGGSGSAPRLRGRASNTSGVD